MEKEKIVKALNTVSLLKGVVCVADITHDIGYISRYLDDYLAIGVMADLIDIGVIELKINEPENINAKKILLYFKKLLGEE